MSFYVFCLFFFLSVLYCIDHLRLQSSHHPLVPDYLLHLSAPSQGLVEWPASPQRPEALGPGSHCDLAPTPPPPQGPHVCAERCYERPQGSLISPWSGLVGHCGSVTLSKQLVYTKYSVQIMAWLRPAAHEHSQAADTE